MAYEFQIRYYLRLTSSNWSIKPRKQLKRIFERRRNVQLMTVQSRSPKTVDSETVFNAMERKISRNEYNAQDKFNYLRLSDYCLHRYINYVSASVLQPSAGVFFCRAREPTLNIELNLLFNPRSLIVLIPLTITRYICFAIANIPFYFSLKLGFNLKPPNGIT